MQKQANCDTPSCERKPIYDVSVPWGDRVRHLCDQCHTAYKLGIHHGRLYEIKGIKDI